MFLGLGRKFYASTSLYYNKEGLGAMQDKGEGKVVPVLN
jgi:hypothetical protein